MNKSVKGKVHIGTSGWHYKHWMGTFYPEGMKSSEFMDYYLKFFRTVEVNNSFYRLPSVSTFSQWNASVPDDFMYAVKASRYITHMKKLKEPKEHFTNFIENARALEEKLGPILFQLPPGWKYNEERLIAFLEVLPNHYRYTMEFRNPSWYNDRVYALLEEKNIAFCIYEIDYHMSPIWVTADFVYVRLHGPEGKYAGSYSDSALQWWVNQCLDWRKTGKDVFFYFDNDQLGYAAFNAKRMIELVGEK